MRKILWYAFLLIPAVFTSCNLEDDSGLIPQENRKLTISFSVQDPASGLATRAAIAPEAGEENIKTLDLIFFESNGNGTGTFKGWKELTSASGSPLEMNTDIVFDFSDIGLKTTDAYDILAVANMGSNYLPTDGSQSMDDWKNAIKNSNFKTARAEVQAFMAGTSADIPEYITKPIVSEALLMSASLRKESEDTKISIVLQRSVARFDVYNSAAGYTLESVSVWNGYPSLFVCFRQSGETNCKTLRSGERSRCRHCRKTIRIRKLCTRPQTERPGDYLPHHQSKKQAERYGIVSPRQCTPAGIGTVAQTQ